MRGKDLGPIAAIVLFYVVLEAFGVTCPILFLTGISCAGCGMSRAWMALLRGDPAGAFAFHPLFWLPVPAAALLLLRGKIPPRTFRRGAGIVCALFLVVYLVRMLAPEDHVVVFQPSQGLIGRVIFRVLAAAGS